jgi:hypothetical protein
LFIWLGMTGLISYRQDIIIPNDKKALITINLSNELQFIHPNYGVDMNNIPFEMYENVRDYIDQQTRDLSTEERSEFLEYLEADVELRQDICESLIE